MNKENEKETEKSLKSIPEVVEEIEIEEEKILNDIVNKNSEIYEKTHNVVIIGAGVAGYTAALYTARATLNPILVTGVMYGGQLMTTSEVENFPGYVNGVSGPKMMEDLHIQSEKFNTKFVVSDVKEIKTDIKPFQIILDNNKILKTNSIIIATGAK